MKVTTKLGVIDTKDDFILLDFRDDEERKDFSSHIHDMTDRKGNRKHLSFPVYRASELDHAGLKTIDQIVEYLQTVHDSEPQK